MTIYMTIVFAMVLIKAAKTLGLTCWLDFNGAYLVFRGQGLQIKTRACKEVYKGVLEMEG